MVSTVLEEVRKANASFPDTESVRRWKEHADFCEQVQRLSRRDFMKVAAMSAAMFTAKGLAAHSFHWVSVADSAEKEGPAQRAKTPVIDPHCHLLKEEWFPQRLWDTIASQLSVHVGGDPQKRMSPEEFREKYFPKFFDPEGAQLLKKMDESGIDVTVLLADDFGMALGEPPVPIEEQNKAIAALANKHPDRLVAFAVVDPRRKNAVQIIERCIKEWGMKGVGEYHPDAGWAPNGRESYRLLERLQEWKVPVIAHTGLFFPPLHSKYTHPLLLDDVCSDFPELKVIAAHSGRTLWWETVANMARIHPNLYGDLAGFQTLARRDYRRFCQILRAYIDIAGVEKILWATDDPVYNVMIPTKEYVEILRNLPQNAPEGIKFTEEEVNAILGGNAQRVLGLNRPPGLPTVGD